jgi:hypothetical protein
VGLLFRVSSSRITKEVNVAFPELLTGLRFWDWYGGTIYMGLVFQVYLLSFITYESLLDGSWVERLCLMTDRCQIYCL